MIRNTNTTSMFKYNKKSPKYIDMPDSYWSQSPFAYKQINGETYVTRVYISTGNRKKYVS